MSQPRLPLSQPVQTRGWLRH